jgi:hypothetical protein
MNYLEKNLFQCYFVHQKTYMFLLPRFSLSSPSSSSSSTASSSSYYSYATIHLPLLVLLLPLLLLHLLLVLPPPPPPPSPFLFLIIIWSHKSERSSVFLHPQKESLDWGSDHCTAPPYKLQHKHTTNADTPSSLERDCGSETWFWSG